MKKNILIKRLKKKTDLSSLSPFQILSHQKLLKRYSLRLPPNLLKRNTALKVGKSFI